jgi:hypothetical protein
MHILVVKVAINPHTRHKYVHVMVKHFNTWIELVVLPQNSFELTTTFLDHVLINEV